ncbi:MAG: TonB-dependent receptor [Bacteroidetes bacterium]|nr:TonB-dependent receptor [Bacteroidota bacterium]
MRRFYTSCVLVLLSIGLSFNAFSQQPTNVSGSIKNSKSKEAVSAVSVTVKGSTTGTFSDDKGNFKFTTVQKPPFTVIISSVGYSNKEVVVKSDNQVIDVELDASFTLGDEVVVAASRVPERILESPVSIERIGAKAILNSPAANYYDMITNLKGVDIVAASLTFKSIGTRGFNSSGNTRLNQIVDGMDNQAPGLNFSVGNIIGLTELDVDNIELLPGASSALYGPGGMNGTLLINSKNPFKYQGLSFQIKQGISNVDNKQRTQSPFYDWTIRWGNKISEKFAYKIGAQYTQATDWLANSDDNYNRVGTPQNPNGITKTGTRLSDPNYDGVNFYGDETNANLSAVASGVLAQMPAGIVPASNAWLAANPTANIAAYNSFLGAIGAGALVAAGYSPIIYGASPTKNYYNNQMVSRTGYSEKDVIDPITSNFKLYGGLYYKLTSSLEASLTANWGTGTTVYTGADRYSIKDFKMGQYKFELKSKNWYLRGYTTSENSGNSYVTTTTTRLFNEAWKSSTAWYPAYAAAYASTLDAVPDQATSHNNARAFADQGRPVGFQLYNPLYQQIAQTPISKGGGLFMDRTKVYQAEGQYNLTDALGLAKSGTDFLIGGSWRQFVLNSQGTIFADTAGSIKIAETGAYAQLSQRLFNDILKVTVSGRYDKNVNFAGHFTPRASAVLKLTKDHNLRFSYQSAYRFPTTQNQWINLNTSQGRLMGGLPQLRDFYKFSSNPAYTLASVTAFGASAGAGAPNPALLVEQKFGEFKPESSTSFEVGYKGLFAKRILIDVYAYWAKYKDFLGGVTVIQSNNGSPAGLIGYNPNFTPGNAALTRSVYSVSMNQTTDVNTNGWGASIEYLMPKNFSISGNVYSDIIGPTPVGFVTYFNTPKYRVNASFNNSGFGPKNVFGFSIVYRWLDGFHYDGTFAAGEVASYKTLDAMVSVKLPKTRSLVKIGGTNILNKYYYTGYGNPQIGGLYYVSFGWNVF